MKKIIALLCAVVMLVGMMQLPMYAAWDGSAASSYAGGSGTVDDPYLIATAEQLAYFRDQVNKGSTSICAKMVDNVDLNNIEWDPIGLSSGGYNGTFDGCGYAIRNLRLSRVSSGSSLGGSILYGCGLFGILGKNGNIKHVNVDGTISIKEILSHNPDIGGICGGNFGVIEECFATIYIKDFDIMATPRGGHINIGGICGVNAGTIKNCYTIGDFDVKVNSKAPVHIGGICGYIYTNGTVMKNCYSVVGIKADTNKETLIGGILGCLESTGTFSNLYTDMYYHNWLTGNRVDKKQLTNSALCGTAYMTSPQFVGDLGNAFLADTENKNLGYPVLAIMAYEEQKNTWSEWFEEEVNGTAIDKELFEKLTPSELRNRDLTQPITRSEFCAVSVKLYEELGGKVYSAAELECPFDDVSNNEITKAYKIGITNGTSATEFTPYAKISRQDMAVMLTRVHKALNLDNWSLSADREYELDYTNIRLFDDDADISNYARNSVYFMVYNNIIKGATETTFAPRNVTSAHEAIGYANATREQAIILSMRMFNKLG